MQRLLDKANEFNAQHGIITDYQIESYADIVDAIHVVQTEMGITGTTADEASKTFSGSMAAMKAAAKNLIGNLSLGEDIGPSLTALQSTTYTFLMKNFFPMVGNVLSRLPQVIGTALSAAVRAINIAADNADEIVRMGIELVAGIAEAATGAIPYLLEAAVNLIAAFGQAILDTDWAAVSTNLVNNIRDALDQASGEIFGSDDSIISAVGESITDSLPALLGKGVEIVTTLANGILDAIPEFITTAGTIVQQLAGFIVENIPAILDAGWQLASNLGQAIEDALPDIFSAVGETVSDLTGGLVPEDAFTQILEALGGLSDAFSPVVGKITELRDKFTESVDSGAIFTTAISGVSTVITSLTSGFTTAIDLVSSFIGWLTSGSAGASAFQTVIVAITAALITYQAATATVTAVTAAHNAITKAMTIAQEGLNAVMAMNPFNMVAAAVVALTAAIAYLWTTNEGFREAVITAWEAVKSAAETVGNAVAGFFTETIPNAIHTALDYFQSLMDGTKEHMSVVEQIVGTALNNISTVFSTVFNVIKGIVNTVLAIIKGDWSGALDALKSVGTAVLDGIRSIFSNNFNLVKNIVSQGMEAVKNFFSEKITAAKEKISSVLDGIKTAFSNKLNAAKTTVSNIFDSIKTSISDKIEAARDVVRRVIDKIRGFFDFSWSLPKLKLPHVSISGSFSLVPPSVPHFSIDWYKKAMTNPMILDSPTIFGAAGGKLLGAGEAGKEVVAGASTLMHMIRSAVGRDYRESPGADRCEQLLERIAALLEGGTGPTIVINGADYRTKRELAEAIADLLYRDITRREAAYG